jgi:hypothetical protein
LLYFIANSNLEQLIGEESEKLESINNTCNNTETQLTKIKKFVERGGSKEHILQYVDHTLQYIARQKCKYCEETAEEVNDDDELYEFVQNIKSPKPIE